MVLNRCQKAAYSIGHVLNDLCAAMWFSFLLVFFHKVLEMSNMMAGNILLIGQIADGIATPFVGYESDKSPFHCKYGRRKSWHLVGTICVIIGFPLLFMNCFGCYENTEEYIKLIYYAPLVVIFQFGWASTQINHLALIPDLTNNDGEKVTLNAFRYAFTVLSSLLVYGLAWIFLQLPNNSTSVSSNGTLSPADASSFRYLVLVTVGIGVVFSILFHIGLREKSSFPSGYSQINSTSSDHEDNYSENNEGTPLIKKSSDSSSTMRWLDWFKRPAFYQMAVLYMCTRLIVNLSQVYLPMYITDTLHLHKTYIAIVPLITYLSSFVSALLARPISILVKPEVMYIGGSLFILASCVWAHFLQVGSLQIIGMAVLLGLGTSIILVVSLSMTATLIGNATNTGAFVYGAMSLTDKLSNGIAVEIIQYLNPCLCNCSKCSDFFRNVMSYLIAAISLVALLNLFIMICTKKFHRDSSTEKDVVATA